MKPTKINEQPFNIINHDLHYSLQVVLLRSLTTVPLACQHQGCKLIMLIPCKRYYTTEYCFSFQVILASSINKNWLPMKYPIVLNWHLKQKMNQLIYSPLHCYIVGIV